jgi:hypothetical protein
LSALLYPTLVVVGYSLLLAALFRQRRNVKRFAAELKLTLPPDQIQARAAWGWIVAGILLTIAGAFWGLPMMLAAGAHRRYIKDVSRDARAQIARGVEAMMERRRKLPISVA